MARSRAPYGPRPPERFLEVPREDCEEAFLYIHGKRLTLFRWRDKPVVIWEDGRFFIDPGEAEERAWGGAYDTGWLEALVNFGETAKRRDHDV